MVCHASADHVKVDINKAADQVFIALNSSSVIAVLPEGSLSFLALIELLGGSPGDQLQALWDDIRPVIDHQQMDMIGGDHVVEYTQAKAFLGFKEPGMPAPPVPGEFQKKFLFVATVGNMPHLPRNMMSVCSRHF